MIRFKLNGQEQTYDGDPSMPLLWYIRDIAGLSGTKFGCGWAYAAPAQCIAMARRCAPASTPMSGVAGQEIVTIEAICGPGDLHPVQKAWIENSVPQCGYCQSGQIMQAIALLTENAETHAMRRSKTPWRETSAAAGPISGFAPPSSRLRG